jgi:hypothetical protein
LTEKTAVDIVGWAGSISVVAAYAMLSMQRVSAKSKLYQVLNIFGSICLIINTIFYSAYPSTFVNIIWMLIGLFALINIYRTRNGTNPR